MLLKLICFLLIGICVGEDTDVEYVDAVIDMLLNGVSRQFEESNEIDDGEEPILSGGIWKCGNCEGLKESRLVYSEVNEVDDNMLTDTSVDVQIGFTLPEMRCITVQSDTAGVVRRVSGSCTSSSITLSVATSKHFTVHIYN